MPLSNPELNRLADSISASDLTCYPHTGAPGANGTTNRVGTGQTLAASSWSDASGGDITYEQAVNFGVLDATQSRTYTHFTLFRGNAFVAWGTFQAATQITAGGTFSAAANTLRILGATT